MKYLIKHFLFIAIFSVCFTQLTHSRELIDKVVAVVNDDIITLTQLNDAMAEINKTSKQKVNQQQALDDLIDRTLIQQEAKKMGITVSDAEVDNTINALKQKYNLQGSEMSEALKKQNMTEEEFREQWKYQLLTKKVLDRKLKGKIAVTDQEIRDYYTKNYGAIDNIEEIRISQILMYNEDEAVKVADLAKSNKEDFADLAKRYSKDESSAANGGDLGFFKEGDLMDTLSNAVEGAKVGEVVGPVETPAGYHILKVTDKKSANEGIPESTKEEIKETLYNQKVQEMLQSYLNEIKETAYIDKKI